MLLAILTLFSGLFLSAVSEYYSIMGLIAIFSADPMPIAIMGVALGVAKLTTTIWLKQNWETAPKTLKAYLMSAVVILMIITSLGCFGLLSKAHSDQSLVSGDAGAKVQIIEEQINTEKENIDAARKSLKQMDDAVDQVMGRSTDVNGASKSVTIRKSQQPERARLQTEITTSQKKIGKLNEAKAPLAADLRKIDSEVGPIKYIAAFIYGTTPDTSLLEKAVTWVIVLIVAVFDPLAVTILLASQYSFQIASQRRKEEKTKEEVAPSINGVMTDNNGIDESTPQVVQQEDAVVPPMPNFIPMPVNRITEWTYNKFEEPTVEVSNEYVKLSDDELDEIAKLIPEPINFEELLEKDTTKIEEWNKWLEDPVSEDLLEDLVEAAEQAVIAENTSTESIIDAKEEISSGYVQNEEQGNGGLWSKIANKTISGDEYIEILKNKKSDDI
jgi:hypothetical protein